MIGDYLRYNYFQERTFKSYSTHYPLPQNSYYHRIFGNYIVSTNRLPKNCGGYQIGEGYVASPSLGFTFSMFVKGVREKREIKRKEKMYHSSRFRLYNVGASPLAHCLVPNGGQPKSLGYLKTHQKCSSPSLLLQSLECECILERFTEVLLNSHG